MNQNYPSYSISLEDRTKHQTGFTPATMRQIQCADNLNSAKPALQDVIKWIDGQATKVREAVNEMRQNKGTTTIVLHARLPMGTAPSGLCEHKVFSDISANGLEIDELKARVTAAYKTASRTI
jgi:hypothetical protein